MTSTLVVERLSNVMEEDIGQTICEFYFVKDEDAPNVFMVDERGLLKNVTENVTFFYIF